MNRFQLVSGALVASLVAVVAPPASGSDTAPTTDLVSSAESTIDDLQLPGSVGFAAADGVAFDEDDLAVSFGTTGSQITLGLPQELQAAEPTVTDAGISVTAPDAGLAAVVEPLGDGAARTVVAADESYADGPVHAYEYALDLPAGAQVVTAPTGGLLVVEPADAAAAAPVGDVDLAQVLGDTSLVDPAELAAIEAEVAADATPALEVDIPAGMVPLAILATPWAVDADGVELPTSLSYEDGVLTQHVDTEGAAFPVVSDPAPLVVIALGAAARALAPHVVRAFAATVIRRGAAYTIQGGYRTFTSFKNAHGAKSGYQWHHIVEQRTISLRGWDPRAIHNPRNLVQIPTAVHQRCVNSWMARTGVRSFGVAAASGQTMRDWVGRQSFSTQHRIGFDLLRHCGVQV